MTLLAAEKTKCMANKLFNQWSTKGTNQTIMINGHTFHQLKSEGKQVLFWGVEEKKNKIDGHKQIIIDVSIPMALRVLKSHA